MRNEKTKVPRRLRQRLNRRRRRSRLESNRKKRKLLARLTMCHLNSVGNAVNYTDIRARRLRLKKRGLAAWHAQNVAKTRYNHAFSRQLYRFVNFGCGHYAYGAARTSYYFNVVGQEAAQAKMCYCPFVGAADVAELDRSVLRCYRSYFLSYSFCQLGVSEL